MLKKEIIVKLSEYYSEYQIRKILENKTDLSQSQLFLLDEIHDIRSNYIEELIKLGKKKYPFEYIIKSAEFFGLDFYVDERVLIPRNDTEVMVEQTIKTINKSQGNNIYIDIGTGSSCIPIAVLKNCSKQNIRQSYVIDISQDALDVSNKNINTHNLNTEIIQLKGSLLEPVIGLLEEHNSIIITANLPYIKDNDHNNMDKETIIYEPDLALYGGENTGFELYEELIKQITSVKSSNSIQNVTLFIEIGFDQRIYSQKYLESLGLEHTYFKDNSGIDRCIEIKL